MESVFLVDILNNIKDNKSKYIEEYDAYAVNVGGFRGVAIETNGEVIINEKFNKVELSNIKLRIKDEEKNVIFLFTKEDKISDSYGMLCLDFLSLTKRELIMKNPIQWFEIWQELLGNQKSTKTVYDILGEMKVLLKLQEFDKNPKWNSSERGSFDITCDDAVYEVKTTQSRIDTYVTIHNQYQLDYKKLNKDLYIAFVRVEKNDSGISIDDLYKNLVDKNFDKEILDEYLRKTGFYEGKADRYKKFLIEDINLYKVDEEFPQINNESFKNDRIPNNVVKIEYTISLDGLDYQSLI